MDGKVQRWIPGPAAFQLPSLVSLSDLHHISPISLSWHTHQRVVPSHIIEETNSTFVSLTANGMLQLLPLILLYYCAYYKYYSSWYHYYYYYTLTTIPAIAAITAKYCHLY